jgi:predicted membrane protein
MNMHRGQLILGAFLIGLGVLLLLGTFLHINMWAVIWSAGLVILGLLLLFRTNRTRSGTRSNFSLIGDTRRSGVWQAENEEIWSGIGDIHLDLTQAALPEGDITLRIYCLIGDVEISVPGGVGLNVVSSGLISELKHRGSTQSSFLQPLTYTSPEFAKTGRRVNVETVALISEVNIRQ